MAAYVGWVKLPGGWLAVAEGATLAEADRQLMRWIAGQRPVPVSSAVLPQGVHPQDRRG
jgi:hypothetical protein